MWFCFKLNAHSNNSQRENNDYSSAAFNLTGSILDLNPEFYTIWNYRREILTNGILKDK